MISRIRNRSGRITWKLQNKYASVEAVISKQKNLLGFFELLTRYIPGTGDDWYKNERDEFHYCLSASDFGYSYCVYNAFKQIEHDYCAYINFTAADVPEIIASFERYFKTYPPDAEKQYASISITDNSQDDDWIDFTLQIGDESVDIRAENIIHPFGDLILWLEGICRGERMVRWELVEFHGPYLFIAKSTDSSFRLVCWHRDNRQKLIDAELDKSEMVETFYRFADKWSGSDDIEDWLEVN